MIVIILIDAMYGTECPFWNQMLLNNAQTQTPIWTYGGRKRLPISGK